MRVTKALAAVLVALPILVGASTAGASTAGASTAGASTAGASTAGASTADVALETPDGLIFNEPHIDFPAGTPSAEERAAAETSIADIVELAEAKPQLAKRALPDNTDFVSGPNDYFVEYATSIPAAHKAVIAGVMADWSNVIDMNNSGIHVRVAYQPLGGNALAGASSYSVVPSWADYAIPTALFNANQGFDGYPGTPDIWVYINSEINWNTQTAGSVPSSQYSLYTTLLHEIGHGLGFSGNVEPGTTASDPLSSFDQRLYYDSSASTSAGPSLPIKTSESPAVTTGAAWFLNLDGTWERIYDPASGYQDGSSMSHFDEESYPGFSGVAGALLSPVLFNGEYIYDIDNVTLGVMEAVGWKVLKAPAPPLVTSAVVGPGSIKIGLLPNQGPSGTPATQWQATVSQGSTVLASGTFSSTKRSLTLPVYLPAGNYSLSIVGQGSGGSSAASVVTATSTNTAPPAYDNCRQAPVNPAFGTANITNASVYRLYCAYFLRYPDPGGFNYWLNEFTTGSKSLDDISNFFAVSDEFGALYGSLSTTQFVDLIYVNVLERPAEAEGYQFWINEINKGTFSRGQVMLFFSQSDEFKIKTGTSD